MDAQQIRQLLTDNKDRLFVTYPLTSIALFGSYADSTANEMSGVDIMVEFNQPVSHEFIELERLLKKRVDIVTRKAIKPGLMNFIQPQLQYV